MRDAGNLLMGALLGLIFGVLMTIVAVGPADDFAAVCKERGGMVYGANGCFKPEDAVLTVKELGR